MSSIEGSSIRRSSIPDNVNQYAAPVLAVCGYSGSGKTTLLEAAIPRLVQRGLAVAVVKHDAHGFEVDRPGKDSDRLFRAGAAVALRGPEEQFERRAEPLSLEITLARLACDHDLLLVEGHKDTPLPKFWLADAERPEPPDGVTGIVSTLPWDVYWPSVDPKSGDRKSSDQKNSDRLASDPGQSGRLAAFLDYIERWLPEAWLARPLYRGLLLGGRSTRMGRPKQSVPFGQRTLGQIALEALSAADPGVVVLGSGPLPETPRAWLRLPDPPQLAGPGAGMIAGHRWAPEAAWIVAACDHPWLRAEHIEWLAAQRRPGRWAILPMQRDGHPCPTLALYEPQALEAIERRSRTDLVRRADPSAALDLPQSAVVEPPSELADGWINVNTPEQLRAEEERLSSHPTEREGKQS